MISVAEAQSRILAAATLMPSEQISVSESLGRVLSRDVSARRTQPPADLSAMDGYAVRRADIESVPATLTRIGEAPAGAAFEGMVGPGETVRIFTGGPVPEGADTIVIQENVETDGETVTIKETAAKGRYVRPKGLDFAVGRVGLAEGTIMTARDVGLAAAMNHPWLHVRRRPKVAILATGDEIVMPGEPIGPDQIVSANELGLAAAVRCFGGEPLLLGVAPDEHDALAQMIDGRRGADILLTTGGASVGERDLVQEALGARGMTLDFWRIAMRPGKPLMFGQLDDCLALGLPGNPVSAMVCALIFLRPAMSKMLGLSDGYETESVRLAAPLAENDRRQDYLRATLSRDDQGRLSARAFEKQDSSMVSLLSHADCLIERAPFAPAAETGEPVQILRFPGARESY